MSYHEKMIYHIEQVEAVGARIDREETEFLAKYRRRTSNDPPDAVERQAMKAFFQSDGFYKGLSSKQDHHVRMATMYGIAAQGLRDGRSLIAPWPTESFFDTNQED